MAEKLTPRVGDRVLVRTTAFTQDARKRTYVGDVTNTNETDVRVIVAEANEAGWWPKDSVTVVDREPVEWPRYPMWRYGDYSYQENSRITSGIWGVKESVGGSTTVINEAASAISADDARKIGEAWLKVAEHWDDLTR